MQRYEYKVIPAPRRGEKTRTAKTAPDRFAESLSALMNSLGRDGWEYMRADTLPCDERAGLTGTVTHFQNMLVFRRPLAAAVAPQLVLVPEVLAVTQTAAVPPLILPGDAANHAPALGPARTGPDLAAE